MVASTPFAPLTLSTGNDLATVLLGLLDDARDLVE
jgi:hypothetical protein